MKRTYYISPEYLSGVELFLNNHKKHIAATQHMGETESIQCTLVCDDMYYFDEFDKLLSSIYVKLQYKNELNFWSIFKNYKNEKKKIKQEKRTKT